MTHCTFTGKACQWSDVCAPDICIEQAKPFDPDWCLCPGDAISRFVEDPAVTDMRSHDDVQAALGINVEEYAQLLRGELPLSPDMGDALAAMCGQSSGDAFWNNFERIYRDALARGKTHVCHPDVTA